MRRLPGGASRETWYFEDGGLRLVLRKNPPGRPSMLPMATEAALLRAAADAGVPVPAVREVRDDGYVMDFIEGETIPRRILRDPPPGMAAQIGEILARIHSIEPPLPPPAEPAVARYRALYDSLGEPHPALEYAFRWLADHEPPARAPRLVHGDFRLGNFIVGPQGIFAVLDWELAHTGDPMEDLGWLLVRSWRFDGIGTREDLFHAYEKESGEAVDPKVVRYWEVFGNLKWGIICVAQAMAHLTGAHRSVELATVGRRAAEAEFDLLELI